MPEPVQDLQALFDKLNVKVTTDEGTKEVNLFSDPVLLYKFMKFCAETFVPENINFLYELHELQKQKVETGLEPGPRILNELYDEYIKPNATTQLNIASTLQESTYKNLMSLESSVESFYAAAQEVNTLLITNELTRFKQAEVAAQREQADRDKKAAAIEADIEAAMAKKQSLVNNRSGEDVTTDEYKQKVEDIDVTLYGLADKKLDMLKEERKRINESFANFEKEQKQKQEQEQKAVQPTKFLKIGAAMLALDTIKRIDSELAKNERAILEHFDNNKAIFNTATFEENQKEQAKHIEKVASALFDALLDERKQLLEEQSVILKASAERPISLETEKKLEEIKAKLEANAAYIETRFNKVDGKNSNTDIEKMRIFRDMLAHEEQQRFNELITKQNVLFSTRMLEKDPTKIAILDVQLADNEAAIEMMLNTAKKNTDPSKQKDFKERSGIFESLTAVQKEMLTAELAKTTLENASTPLPEPKAQSQPKKHKDLTKTLAVEDLFYPLLRQREALFTERLNEKDPETISQIHRQLEANHKTILLIINGNEEKADIFDQVKKKEFARLPAAEKKASASRSSQSKSRGSQSESRGSQSTPKEVNTQETSRPSQSKSPEPTTSSTPKDFDALITERLILIANQVATKTLSPIEFQKALESNTQNIARVALGPEKEKKFSTLLAQEAVSPILLPLLSLPKEEKTLPEKRSSTTKSALLFKKRNKHKGFFKNLVKPKLSDEGESPKSRNSGGPGSRGSQGGG
ncbi:MAG: hypothetical protein KBD03_02640 [Gammaproteobacteria bacterium]|nr:hypothetical protein [Gammaproteobacteria bacterium]